MMRVSDFTIESYPPRGVFETVQGVTVEDLNDAFTQAVEAAGRDPESPLVQAARHHLHALADIIVNSTWGTILKLDSAQCCLESALRQLGIDPPPPPPACPLN